MFDSTQPVRRERFFVGRESLLPDLNKGIISSVYIGEARIGRTSLLLQIERTLGGTAARRGPRIPFYLNLRKPTLDSPSTVYSTLIRAILARAESTLEVKIEYDHPRDEVRSEDLIRLLDEIVVQGGQLEVVLLLDNLDKPPRFLESRLDFFSGLRKILDYAPEGSIKLLASASPEFKFLEVSIVSKLLSRLRQRTMGPLSKESAKELMYLHGKIRSSKRAEVICNHVFDETGGHPCLIQEILEGASEARSPNQTMLRAIQSQVIDLYHRGGSFFQQYLRELPLDQITQLISIAFSPRELGVNIPLDSKDRFASAGLLSGTTGEPYRASCRIFFGWLQENLSRVLPDRLTEGSSTHSLGGLAHRLKVQLPAALSNKLPSDEKFMQTVIQGMLGAYDIPFSREEPISTPGKTAKVDFGLASLNCALEVKLVRGPYAVGKIIDELLADIELYSTRYGSLLGVIASPKFYKRLRAFVDEHETPYCQFVVAELHDGK